MRPDPNYRNVKIVLRMIVVQRQDIRIYILYGPISRQNAFLNILDFKWSLRFISHVDIIIRLG